MKKNSRKKESSKELSLEKVFIGGASFQDLFENLIETKLDNKLKEIYNNEHNTTDTVILQNDDSNSERRVA